MASGMLMLTMAGTEIGKIRDGGGGGGGVGGIVDVGGKSWLVPGG